MKILHGLETKIADVAKGLPHLPKELTKWLGENAWWLTLIGVVIGGFGLFALLPLTILASGALTVASGFYPYAYVNTGAYVLAAWVSLAFLVATVVIEGLAISPLKVHKKLGWDLIFLSVLVSATSSVVNALITTNFFNIFGAALGLAISLYVLFEVRSQFDKK